MKKAFSLVELMIVVAILGILSAVAIPQFNNHIQEAKEAAAKDNLRILREAIERYAADHDGIPPSYSNNDTTTSPAYLFVAYQLLYTSNKNGQVAESGYKYGPYLKDLPENPFNNGTYIKIIKKGETFPDSEIINQSNPVGWIYKPSTKEVRINKFGVDSKGMNFSDY